MINFEDTLKDLNKEGWQLLNEYSESDIIILIGRISLENSGNVEIKWIDQEGKEYSDVTTLDIEMIKSINKVLLEK